MIPGYYIRRANDVVSAGGKKGGGSNNNFGGARVSRLVWTLRRYGPLSRLMNNVIKGINTDDQTLNRTGHVRIA
jgi:hypothetical protein